MRKELAHTLVSFFLKIASWKIVVLINQRATEEFESLEIRRSKEQGIAEESESLEIRISKEQQVAEESVHLEIWRSKQRGITKKSEKQGDPKARSVEDL